MPLVLSFAETSYDSESIFAQGQGVPKPSSLPQFPQQSVGPLDFWLARLIPFAYGKASRRIVTYYLDGDCDVAGAIARRIS